MQESAAEPRAETRPPTYQSSAQHTTAPCRGTCWTGGRVSVFFSRFPGYFQSKLRPGSQSNLTLNAKSKC